MTIFPLRGNRLTSAVNALMKFGEDTIGYKIVQKNNNKKTTTTTNNKKTTTTKQQKQQKQQLKKQQQKTKQRLCREAL